jgi:hypothetical protein
MRRVAAQSDCVDEGISRSESDCSLSSFKGGNLQDYRVKLLATKKPLIDQIVVLVKEAKPSPEDLRYIFKRVREQTGIKRPRSSGMMMSVLIGISRSQRVLVLLR